MATKTVTYSTQSATSTSQISAFATYMVIPQQVDKEKNGEAATPVIETVLVQGVQGTQ